MGVQVPLEEAVSQSFGYIPKSGIAGSNVKKKKKASSAGSKSQSPFHQALGLFCPKVDNWLLLKDIFITHEYLSQVPLVVSALLIHT
jgi:hypothetical protein